MIDNVRDDPVISVHGYDEFTHKLWELKDEHVIEEITALLNDKVLFIADGHHRYQTAVDFAREQQEKTGATKSEAPFNYRMVILVNMFDSGLSILPTHRLIKMPGLSISDLIEKMRQYFTVEENSIRTPQKDYTSAGRQIMDEIRTREGSHRFALYSAGKYFVLTLKDDMVMDELASDRSKTWRQLDVSILHKIVLEHLMGINEYNLEDHVRYTRGDSEAVKRVDTGEFTLSFLMNATKIEELKAIAEAGEHMPQKSTYFLPKMLSGLVIYKM
jgi:uncharacterized protein (DUF1015 family)